jgi:poly-gamma-glutamate synthesis protein (capsule biosynthesis protein)
MLRAFAGHTVVTFGLLCGLIGLLPGCWPAPASQPGEQPGATPASFTSPIDNGTWQVLYQRPGWAGGDTIDIRAVGDVMLGRGVADQSQAHGWDYPFARIGTTSNTPLLGGDLTLGNLESPLVDHPVSVRPGPYRLPAPTAFGDVLRTAGFQVLSLANNHALDAGPAGLHTSVTTLTMAGIDPLGVGADTTRARQPLYREVNGLRVALLGLNAVADPEDQPDEGQDWGRAWLDDQAVKSVQQAHAGSDLVIVVTHWGVEYMSQPSAAQRTWAQQLVAAGADLIVGAHPHVLQPIEPLSVDGHTGLVAYSLGNLLFDQSFRAETRTGAVLRVLADGQGVALAAVAVTDTLAGQVHQLPLSTTEAQQALQALGGTPDRNITTPAAHPTLQAWQWNGTSATPVTVPRQTPPVARSDVLLADLRGDGEPLWATRNVQGIVTVRDGPDEDAPIVWQNEAEDWYVSRMAVGDPNNDGRIELFLLLWKPDLHGVMRSHPFLLGWRGGRYQIIWGGSATATPMQDVAIADLDGNGETELVVLDGGIRPDDPGNRVSIWHWQSWLFHQVWHAPAGSWDMLALQDVTGDQVLEIVAATSR